MLTGHVTSDNEAILPIAVLGTDGRMVEVDAAIDTGYNGFLTLSKTVIEELDLSFVGPTRATLGDGNEVNLDLFLGIIQWEGGPRDVLVLETEGGTLVGMALLGGYRVTMDVEPGGMISIESLAKPAPRSSPAF
jgi:clan AA aspartic protease